MDMEVQDLVRQSSLFKEVSPDCFKQVVETGVSRSIEEGGFFFMQGDPATHAYVLVEGRVKMIQITPNGQQITLRIMTPGQTYGGIALLNPRAGYPATAQAEEDSTALAWDTQHLRQLVEKEPSISLNVMSLMHGYISELQERQKALVTDRVEQRIARVLLKLAAQSGTKIDEGVLIDLPITRQDIAEMSGTTLYTVSRTLNEWDRGGLLEIGRERVVICEPHLLVSIADDLVEQ
ncbi:MAG: Crp/Fnr family transcriptional regulator [Anaerolineales bacterium]|nr:Crp/Fnr family transcriptional regulator [Anaerolineales bacterium]